MRDYVGYLLLGSAISFAVVQLFLPEILFHYSSGKLLDYDYLLATLFFIPLMTLAVYLFFFLRRGIFGRLERNIEGLPPLWRPVLYALAGGATVGTLLWLMPLAAFSGRDIFLHLINEKVEISVGFLFLLVLLRIVATTFSLSVHAVGGLFLPLMSIGALLGYGFAEAFRQYGFLVEPYYFAAIGAAIYVGVVMRLPFTSVMLAMEITYDFNVVVPTALGVVLVSYLVNLPYPLRKFAATRDQKDETPSRAP
jgi:CIC family chloride channel protein